MPSWPSLQGHYYTAITANKLPPVNFTILKESYDRQPKNKKGGKLCLSLLYNFTLLKYCILFSLNAPLFFAPLRKKKGCQLHDDSPLIVKWFQFQRWSNVKKPYISSFMRHTVQKLHWLDPLSDLLNKSLRVGLWICILFKPLRWLGLDRLCKLLTCRGSTVEKTAPDISVTSSKLCNFPESQLYLLKNANAIYCQRLINKTKLAKQMIQFKTYL